MKIVQKNIFHAYENITFGRMKKVDNKIINFVIDF